MLSSGNAHKKSLKFILILTSSYFVIQLIFGIKIGSLAVISDAGHMIIDVAGLLMALLAVSFTQREATPKRTFGFYRAEILASFLNSLFLILLSIFILIEASQRIVHPSDVNGIHMILIASIGLGVNLIGVRILSKAHAIRKSVEDISSAESHSKHIEENLNMHGAYLEVFADTIGSAGVILAGIIIHFTQLYLADPLISIGIAALIVPRTWFLMKKAIHILIEGAPHHLDHNEIKNSIMDIKGVTGVFDLHIWTISSGIYALSAHVMVMDNNRGGIVLQEINSILEKRFRITHATIQVESYHESDNL